MAKYGIHTDKAYGWSIPQVRTLAKRVVTEVGKKSPDRHALALELWPTGVHEAQLLAPLVDSPEWVTEEQADAWVATLDSWDVCDQLCNNLLGDCPFAWAKAVEWSARSEEFVKRAGFALMAVLAWHGKGATDDQFVPFLAAIERESGDERNYVKKADQLGTAQHRQARRRAARPSHRVAPSA